MPDLAASAGWGFLIGASLLVGAAVAAGLSLPQKVAAMLTAFGGGILFAAVALELVPDADAEAGPALTAAGLVGGALVYVAADRWLNRDQDTMMMRRSASAASAGRSMTMPAGGSEVSRGESIAVGLFVDGVPESIALGLTVAEGEVGIALLVGIVVGNLVEAYGAAQPIVAGGKTRGFAVGLLGLIGLALALATILGGTVLADASPELIGTTQGVAAGAVLAVISIAIIPHAFEEVSGLVAMATVLGFIGGYLLS
jgi:zinc transporter, ZIP family